jgi:SNF2 family DNA or RNA helicase
MAEGHEEGSCGNLSQLGGASTPLFMSTSSRLLSPTPSLPNSLGSIARLDTPGSDGGPSSSISAKNNTHLNRRATPAVPQSYVTEALLALPNVYLGEFNFRVKLKPGGSNNRKSSKPESDGNALPRFPIPKSAAAVTMPLNSAALSSVGNPKTGPEEKSPTESVSAPAPAGKKRKRPSAPPAAHPYPGRAGKKSGSKLSEKKRKHSSNVRGRKTVWVGETTFPKRAFEATVPGLVESYLTLHVQKDLHQTHVNEFLRPGDAIDVLVHREDVGGIRGGAGNRQYIGRWLRRCFGRWTSARVDEVAVDQSIFSFQLEYDDKRLSQNFGGYMENLPSKVRKRGVNVLQENKDVRCVMQAVASGHVRIDEATFWSYPTVGDWYRSQHELWPNYAKQVVRTLLLVGLRLSGIKLGEQGDQEETAIETRNNPISRVLHVELLFSMILSFLPLVNVATHEPMDEYTKQLQNEAKKVKKLKRNSLGGGVVRVNVESSGAGNVSENTNKAKMLATVIAPKGTFDRSSSRRRPKNERRLELKLTLLHKSLSIVSLENYMLKGTHLVQTEKGYVGMDWNEKLNSKKVGPGVSHLRKPLLNFLSLVEHVAEHNYTIGCTLGPHRPRVLPDNNPDNPWAREPVVPLATADTQPYPTEFSLESLLEGVRPNPNAPTMEDIIVKQIPGLVSTLMPYQSRAVRWMNAVESKEYSFLIPKDEGCYGFRPIVTPRGNGQPMQNLFVHTFSRHMITTDPSAVVDEYPVGGILADEMGLGKTVEIIALILSRPRPEEECKDACFPERLRRVAGVVNEDEALEELLLDRATSKIKRKLRSYENVNEDKKKKDDMFDASAYLADANAFTRVPIKSTLVIVPQTIIQQWVDEFKKHAPSLRVMRYSGMDQRVWAQHFLDKDVILTTYRTLREDERAGGVQMESPLVHCEWWRIVLDEAQMVRTVVSAPSQIVARMTRKHAWCSSGSPLSGRLNSLIGLFEVLDFNPVREPLNFKRSLLTPYEKGSYYGLARTYRIMQRTMWRHRKEHVQDQITLHSCQVIDDWVDMDPLQRKQYDRYLLEWDRKLLRNNMLPSDNSRLASQRLMQLRQTLCHPLVCSKSRSRTIQEDYAFLQRACENRKLSTLRELCNNTIELGKGMYEHERVDLEETIAAVALAEGHADAVVEGGARPAGTQALITLQSALQEIKMGRGFLGAMEKPQTVKSFQTLELNCLEAMNFIAPFSAGLEQCWAAAPTDGKSDGSTGADFLKRMESLQELLGTNAQAVQRANEARRGSSRSRRATTIMRTIESTEASNARSFLKPMKALMQNVKRSRGKFDEALRDLEALSMDAVGVDAGSRNGCKLDRMVWRMKQIQSQEPGAKVVIFSQYPSFLKIAKYVLEEENGIQTVYLSGQKVEIAVEQFTNDSKTVVLLIPMKTLGGAAGLSLTMARYGMILDASFDPSIEAQAVGRLYRIGQTRSVKVWRLLVKSSIEETMLEEIKEGRTRWQ